MPEFVIGRIPVLESLRARKREPRRLFLLRGAKGLDDIRASAGGTPVQECSRDELDRMVDGAVHQGVVLEANRLPVYQVDDWGRRDHPTDSVVVALDEIEDPHNFGAIARSAAACGARGILYGTRRAAPISPASLKSAAGAMEYIDLVETANLVRGLKTLKEAGFWVAGFDADAPELLWDANLSGKIVLVIGSEGKGMRRLVRETCDMLLRIPITGPITSLNASVSAGVALAECMRQRRPASSDSSRS